MQLAVRSGEHRRGEHLPDRYIHIGNAILKDRLLCRILQLVEIHVQIRPIAVRSLNMNPVCRIEHIDNLLLHVLVKRIIECIDPYRLPKDLRKTRADRRKRIGDDREAALLADDILIVDPAFLPDQPDGQFLLLLVIGDPLLLRLRRERLLAEHLHDRRSANLCRYPAARLKGLPIAFDLAIDKDLIQPQSRVFLVIKIILFVYRCRIRNIYRPQPELCEVLHRRPDHTLESDRELNLDG